MLTESAASMISTTNAIIDSAAALLAEMDCVSNERWLKIDVSKAGYLRSMGAFENDETSTVVAEFRPGDSALRKLKCWQGFEVLQIHAYLDNEEQGVEFDVDIAPQGPFSKHANRELNTFQLDGAEVVSNNMLVKNKDDCELGTPITRNFCALTDSRFSDRSFSLPSFYAPWEFSFREISRGTKERARGVVFLAKVRFRHKRGTCLDV